MVSALCKPPVTPRKKGKVRAGPGEGMSGSPMALDVTHQQQQEQLAPQQHLLHIHRCRFLDWEPRAVVCMATSASGHLLAVARESGAVEIRRVQEKFRVVGVVPLPSRKEGLIRSLAWSRDMVDSQARLFVGSLDTTVCEIDVAGMRVRHKRDSYGGAVWCLAMAPDRDILAVGCEDGSVKLFSTADNSFEFARALPTVNARVLSLAWQPKPPMSARDAAVTEAVSSSSSTTSMSQGLFVGAVDGTIRHLDATTGHSAYRMTVEGRNSLQPAMIWCLKALPDGTLVGGDSLGSIHFWDGLLGTLQQSFAIHEADVLALESSPTGDAVFAAGVDSKLVCLKRQPQEDKWVVMASNRAHSHDLTALALVSKQGERGNQAPLLVSGGKDTKMCTYSMGAFAHTRPRYIAPYPYHPVANVAPRHASTRLLLMQHDRKLHLWQLGADRHETTSLLRQELMPTLEVQAAHGALIVCSALSPDGRYVAYATTEDMRLFELEVDDDRIQLQRRKLNVLTKSVGKGVTTIAFSTDAHQLVVGTRDGRLFRLELESHDKENAVEEAVDDQADGLGRGIVLLSCSADARHVAVGRWNGDVEVYAATEGKKGELALSWRLPRLDSAPTALAYHPEADVLVIACVSNRFYLFDTDTQQLADWSKDMGHRLPRELLDRQDCVLGLCFNVDSPNTLLLHGFGFLCYVDLDRPMGRHVQLLPESHPAALAQRENQRRKRKQQRLAQMAQKKKNKKDSKRAVEVPPLAPAATAEASGRRRRTRGDSLAEEETAIQGAAKAAEAVEQQISDDDDDDADEELNACSEEEEGWNFKLHLGYQGIMAVQSLGHDEVLLVEEPWIKIVSKLPEVLHRQRYGT